MSDAFVPERYDERVTRLAIGVEPVDALGGGRVRADVRVLVEDEPAPLHRWRRWRPGETLHDVLDGLTRHRSGRFGRVYGPGTPGGAVTFRIVERRDRQVVPRRLGVVLADEATVAAADLDPAGPHPLWRRVFRVGLFPGSAAPLVGRHTVVRGRVLRAADDAPVRWTRVVAEDAAGALVGWAHGDDRGEFLLAVGHAAGDVVVPDDPMPVSLTVGARLPPAPPDPADPLRATVDPLWDLPVEPLAPAQDQAADDAHAGRALLPGHASFGPFPFDVPLGRTTSVQIRIP